MYKNEYKLYTRVLLLNTESDDCDSGLVWSVPRTNVTGTRDVLVFDISKKSKNLFIESQTMHLI